MSVVYSATRLSQDLLEFRISLRLAKMLFHFILFCLFCSILILTFWADKVSDKDTKKFCIAGSDNKTVKCKMKCKKTKQLRRAYNKLQEYPVKRCSEENPNQNCFL